MTHGSAPVPDRPACGVLDTCAFIDLDVIDPAGLPTIPEITAVTLAALPQGVAMAKDSAIRARGETRRGNCRLRRPSLRR